MTNYKEIIRLHSLGLNKNAHRQELWLRPEHRHHGIAQG